jgi:hypothetical protein
LQLLSFIYEHPAPSASALEEARCYADQLKSLLGQQLVTEMLARQDHAGLERYLADTLPTLFQLIRS